MPLIIVMILAGVVLSGLALAGWSVAKGADAAAKGGYVVLAEDTREPPADGR